MATSAAGGLTYESFAHWLGLASGVLLLAVALFTFRLRRRGHRIPGSVPWACVLYGVGSLLKVVGNMLSEVAETAFAAVMVLFYAAGLICLVVGLRELRRGGAGEPPPSKAWSFWRGSGSGGV